MRIAYLREKLDFVKADMLLLAPFLATLPIYSPSLAIFHDLVCTSEDLMSCAMYSMMFSAIILGALFAFASLRHHGGLFAKTPLVAAGVACLLGGYLLLGLVFTVEALGVSPLAVLAGVLLAAGSIELGVACGMYLSAFDMRQALFITAVVVGLSSILRLAMSALATNGLTTACLVVFGVLAAAGAALPLWKALAGELIAPAELAPEAEADAVLGQLTNGSRPEAEPKDARTGFLQGVKRMAQVAGMPFVGLLVFAFVMGVRKMYVLDVIYIEMISDIIAAVLVVPLSLVTLKRPLLPFIYQQVLPIAVVALIILNSFPEATWPMWLASMASYVLYSALAILALASLSAMAHAREFSPVLIFSASMAFFALLSVAGIQCGTLELFDDQDGGPALLVVSTCYFALVIVVALLQLGKREEVEVAEAPSKENELLARCNRVAETGGLSPRETEVLAYLGRGHGVAFVASSLVVSESTVRTHVKNIYRKLGVSSREELLQLIDQ